MKKRINHIIVRPITLFSLHFETRKYINNMTFWLHNRTGFSILKISLLNRIVYNNLSYLIILSSTVFFNHIIYSKKNTSLARILFRYFPYNYTQIIYMNLNINSLQYRANITQRDSKVEYNFRSLCSVKKNERE